MRTYYIVEMVNVLENKEWRAYRRGIWSTFNKFTMVNLVIGATSFSSPDECETYLKRTLSPVKPKIIRVVKI